MNVFRGSAGLTLISMSAAPVFTTVMVAVQSVSCPAVTVDCDVTMDWMKSCGAASTSRPLVTTSGSLTITPFAE